MEIADIQMHAKSTVNGGSSDHHRWRPIFHMAVVVQWL